MKCTACLSNPGFIRVLKGNREVWGPCICNALRKRKKEINAS